MVVRGRIRHVRCVRASPTGLGQRHRRLVIVIEYSDLLMGGGNVDPKILELEFGPIPS